VTNLLLRFAIRFENYDITFSPNGPLFHRCMPNGKNDEIVLDTGDPDFSLKIWFERRGFVRDGMIEYAISRKEVDPQIIPTQGILDAGPMSCLLEVRGLSEVQISIIKDNKIGDPEFVKIGKTIVRKIPDPINNLINVIRIRYGQYWLNPIEHFDSKRSSLGSYCQSLQMEYSLDNGNSWNDFVPDRPVMRGISFLAGSFPYYLSEKDWLQIKKTANEKYDPSIAEITLNQACHYLDQGHLKHAIIEGITALELSIEEFFQKKLQNNNSLIAKLGEFKQLHLPTKMTMLATSLNVPNDKIETVSEIIKIRNNIAHRGIGTESNLEVRRKLITMLNVVSTIIYGIEYRFPRANHGNSIRPMSEWEKDNKQ